MTRLVSRSLHCGGQSGVGGSGQVATTAKVPFRFLELEMPKSYTDLWSQITCWEHLVLAYKKCRRRQRFKKPAIEFYFEWESNLIRLQNELASESWEPGEYHNFPISDPKPRLISVAPFRDRIVHHAIVNVL